MKLRQAKKILCRKKNCFWRPRIMVYASGLCEDHRIGKAIRRVRAYQKKGGKLWVNRNGLYYLSSYSRY